MADGARLRRAPTGRDPRRPRRLGADRAALDWVAALIADRLDLEPIDLMRPAVVVGMLAGLAAEGLIAATDGGPQHPSAVRKLFMAGPTRRSRRPSRSPLLWIFG